VHRADLTNGCSTEGCFRRTNARANGGTQLFVEAHERAKLALHSLPSKDSLLHFSQTTQIVEVLRRVKNVQRLGVSPEKLFHE
jgi:hypothetical protein